MRKKKKNKISYKTRIIVVLVLALIFTYFFVFIMFRPFDGMITKDRPVIRTLCQMQVVCNIGEALYQCYSVKQHKYVVNARLEAWPGYNGCNQSTLGFREMDDGYKGIYVEGCGCGGLN